MCWPLVCWAICWWNLSRQVCEEAKQSLSHKLSSLHKVINENGEWKSVTVCGGAIKSYTVPNSHLLGVYWCVECRHSHWSVVCQYLAQVISSLFSLVSYMLKTMDHCQIFLIHISLFSASAEKAKAPFIYTHLWQFLGSQYVKHFHFSLGFFFFLLLSLVESNCCCDQNKLKVLMHGLSLSNSWN